LGLFGNLRSHLADSFLGTSLAPHHSGLIETNITKWRRAVCGDLTSAFNFAKPNAEPFQLPATEAYLPTDHERHPDYVPTPPTQQSLPVQEPGLRRARALPYELRVDGAASLSRRTLRIDFNNTGDAGACFLVRSGIQGQGPWTYTVEAGKSLANTWDTSDDQGRYDLSVFGPNGFLRHYRGVASPSAAVDLDIDVSYDVDDYALIVRVTNQARTTCRVTASSLYGRDTWSEVLPRGKAVERRLPLKLTFGWYDLTITTDTDTYFVRRIAGHLENGDDSVSDPALGGLGSLNDKHAVGE
jgi:phospholipase C